VRENSNTMERLTLITILLFLLSLQASALPPAQRPGLSPSMIKRGPKEGIISRGVEATGMRTEREVEVF
jgi:hypothetical protein